MPWLTESANTRVDRHSESGEALYIATSALSVGSAERATEIVIAAIASRPFTTSACTLCRDDAEIVPRLCRDWVHHPRLHMQI